MTLRRIDVDTAGQLHVDGMRVQNSDVQRVIHRGTLYRPQPVTAKCASGDRCLARGFGPHPPSWLRPPSWQIGGQIYCADCTLAWAESVVRLERDHANAK